MLIHLFVCCFCGCVRLDFSEQLSGSASYVVSDHSDQTLPLLLFASGVTRGMLLFFNRQAPEAVVALESITQFLPCLRALQFNFLHCFFLALSLIEACPKCTLAPNAPMLSVDDAPSSGLPLVMPADYDGALVIRTLERVDKLIAQMSIWADRASCNYLHKLHLMQAERNRLAIFSHLAHVALILPTLQLYEVSSVGARRNQFPLDEALSVELTGRYLAHLQRSATAREAFLRSYGLYSAFGAGMKLRQLEAEYPDIPFQVATEVHLPSLRSSSKQARQQHASSRSKHPAHSSSSSATSAASPLPLPSALSSSLSSSVTTTPSESGAKLDDLLVSGGVNGGVNSWQACSSGQQPSSSAEPPAALAEHDETSSSSSSSSSFDMLSVLKATASFSVEKDQSKLLKRLMRIVLETAGATRGVLVLQNAQQEWDVELGGCVEIDDAAAEAREPLFDKQEEEKDAGAEGPSTDAFTEPCGASSNSSQSSYTTGSSFSDGTHIRFGASHVPGMASLESALPASVFQYVLGSMAPLLISDPHKQTDAAFSVFGQDLYFSTHRPRALLCMPVLRAGAVFGVLYLENDYRSAAFTSSHIQLLQLLCSQAALSIDNARLYAALSETNASLELQVQARTAELEEKNRQLSAAKEAAEAATKIKADFLSNM